VSLSSSSGSKSKLGLEVTRATPPPVTVAVEDRRIGRGYDGGPPPAPAAAAVRAASEPVE
jgi:hypothetical protein